MPNSVVLYLKSHLFPLIKFDPWLNKDVQLLFREPLFKPFLVLRGSHTTLNHTSVLYDNVSMCASLALNIALLLRVWTWSTMWEEPTISGGFRTTTASVYISLSRKCLRWLAQVGIQPTTSRTASNDSTAWPPRLLRIKMFNESTTDKNHCSLDTRREFVGRTKKIFIYSLKCIVSCPVLFIPLSIVIVLLLT